AYRLGRRHAPLGGREPDPHAVASDVRHLADTGDGYAKITGVLDRERQLQRESCLLSTQVSDTSQRLALPLLQCLGHEDTVDRPGDFPQASCGLSATLLAWGT